MSAGNETYEDADCFWIKGLPCPVTECGLQFGGIDFAGSVPVYLSKDLIHGLDPVITHESMTHVSQPAVVRHLVVGHLKASGENSDLVNRTPVFPSSQRNPGLVLLTF